MNTNELIPGTKVIYSVYPLFHQVSGVVTNDGQIAITDPQGLELCKVQGISKTASIHEVHEIHTVH